MLHEDSIRPLGIVFGLKAKGEKDCGLVVLRGDQPSPSHDWSALVTNEEKEEDEGGGGGGGGKREKKRGWGGRLEEADDACGQNSIDRDTCILERVDILFECCYDLVGKLSQFKSATIVESWNREHK